MDYKIMLKHFQPPLTPPPPSEYMCIYNTTFIIWISILRISVVSGQSKMAPYYLDDQVIWTTCDVASFVFWHVDNQYEFFLCASISEL